MKLTVKDYVHEADALIGKLYINDVFYCYTLEDWATGTTHRVNRGTYPVVFRNEGTVNDEYKVRFKDIHKGMLHVLVGGRLYILIHCGNTDADTLGCLLLGMQHIKYGSIQFSTVAYRKVYPVIAAAIAAGEAVTLTYAAIPAELFSTASKK